LLKSIAKTTRDILSPEVLKFILKIGFGTLLFWGVILAHILGLI